MRFNGLKGLLQPLQDVSRACETFLVVLLDCFEQLVRLENQCIVPVKTRIDTGDNSTGMIELAAFSAAVLHHDGYLGQYR